MKKKKAYQLSISKVLEKLKSNPKYGLSDLEVNSRRQQHGLNEIPNQSSTSILGLLLDQFKDFMVLILIGAVIISGFLGQMDDVIAIMAIIILNAVMGFIQEYRAEKSLEALKELTAPQALVLRDGEQREISTEQLVPGDIIYLKSGDKIPADGRLIEGYSLEIDEAALTGESISVTKKLEPIAGKEIALGDRRNMVYMGTTVVRGKAQAVVTATGLKTEMGQIADLLQNSEERATPLQNKLNQLGKWLVYLCLAACAAIVALGVAQGESIYNMFLAGVSLAVAAIPEGLPAVVTLSLAIGVQRMIKRQAIVRKLPAVETLGCATTICSDKTGTLTMNRMEVKKVYTNNQSYDFDSSLTQVESIREVFKIGAICNNAEVKHRSREVQGKAGKLEKNLFSEHQNSWKIIGDSTEAALLIAAQKLGLKKEQLRQGFSKLWEAPFDSNRKRMSVIGRKNDRHILYLKGAPDIVLDRCTHYLLDAQVKRLDNQELNKFKHQNEKLSAQALRVLAVAKRKLPNNFNENQLEDYESDLVFVGLIGMIDPPRPEVKRAIARCKRAGIRTVMVTGDHKNTAQAIAEELKLLDQGEKIVTGNQLKQMSAEELKRAVNQIGVYARVSPEDKLRIVKALQGNGEITAMTGDGVNDAPAIKEADIGIAMGKTGTDVTKEASSLVLADDNFQTIVAAVEEGRTIYDNIRKFIRYLLSCNIGEILSMFLAFLFALPLPLLPIQILWINFVTDGLPALALGMEEGADNVMQRPPREPEESVFAQGLKVRIITQGILIGLSTIFAFILGLRASGGDLVVARTMAFTNLVMAQLFFVFSCRSEEYSIFEMNPFSNPYVIIAVIISFVMQLAVLYLPLLANIFETAPLAREEWLLVLITSGSATLLVELFEGLTHLLTRFFASLKF